MTIKELDDDCACGGGAISGHATGCPEAARFASPPSPASGAVAWLVSGGGVESTLWFSKSSADAVARNHGQTARALYTPPSPAPSASMGRVTDAMVDEAQAVLQQWGMEHGSRTAARLALQAALDSPPDHGGGEGWQSIETAPKDGSEVLIWLGAPWSKVEKARWYAPWTNWQAGTIPSDPAREELHGIGSAVPTHWRPVPAAPTQESEDGR